MLSDDSDNEDIHQLTINEHFAKAFEYRKEREELAKRIGSRSEDEDGEELTPAVDVAILRTLARIKRKDPSIYESGKDVFEEERQKTGQSTLTKRAPRDKSKPLTLRQHALQSVLDPTSRSPSPEPLTHVEEQKALQQETIAAFHSAISDDDEEDDLLVPREKTKDELEREEEEYKEFLEREVGEDLRNLVTVESEGGVKVEEVEVKSRKKKKDKKKGNEKEGKKSRVENDQEFLMNYILNRGWIDKSERRLPTYREITAKGKGKANATDDGDLSMNETDGENGNDKNGLEDENEFDDVADYFESTYNFRFEEPGAAEIARYPRNIESLVRRQDSSRKEERERRKARKEEEIQKKKEEVKRLKTLKNKELKVKLERIGIEGGIDETAALQALDLEGDWDPDSYDRQMTDIYGQDLPVDDDKPHWDDDIDIGDIVPPGALDSDHDGENGEGESKKKKKKKKKKATDEWNEGGVDVDDMDADVLTKKDTDDWDGTEEMRKRVLEKHLDEVYDLEFNDVVAGIPTRFKYTKVQPQTFALTPEEILLATDAELNQYMGIKKYAPYRKGRKQLGPKPGY
ncbi:hypothetical protein QCA50_004746 [Cerrena zonata]|uniref:Kri1-like C-terminal domain-containing protein n=1 Tax=Cerrena zonata TaxID=2478898 RepID=A0AAW0GDF9_9APHY